MNIYNSIYYVLLLIIIYFIIKYSLDKNKRLIIDVRTKEEWDINHYPNAIHIPYNELNKLNVEKDTQIILYCNTGRRAKIGKEILIKSGYKAIKIINLHP
jgi:rhodanese-related sulfurtransferase